MKIDLFKWWKDRRKAPTRQYLSTLRVGEWFKFKDETAASMYGASFMRYRGTVPHDSWNGVVTEWHTFETANGYVQACKTDLQVHRQMPGEEANEQA